MMPHRSPVIPAVLGLAAVSIAPVAGQQETPRRAVIVQKVQGEAGLQASAPAPPEATTLGDGTRIRAAARWGSPVEPALALDEEVLGSRRAGPAWTNLELRRTLVSIDEAGGAPTLVFSPDLRRLAYRAGSRTQEVRTARRAVVTRPVTRRVARPSGSDRDRLGAELDPVATLDLPPEMPAVRWPTFVDGSCTGGHPGGRLWEVQRAWALAHHHVWRAYQLLEFIGESPGQFRDDYWSDGYSADEGDANWSPRAWLGPYAGHRLAAIREVVKELWDRFRTGEFDGIAIRVKCPTPANEPNNPGNICFTHAPPAHHVVKGWIDLCEGFFDEEMEAGRPLLIAHEMLHHARVTWKEGDLWKARFLGDTHLHGHGDACLSELQWEKMYQPRARHLASYSGCWHPEIAMRNNDSYAWFIHRLGSAVRRGELKRFPTEGVPWQTPGETGNECSENPHPPPGPDIQDPEECFKAGGEWVCPGGGGGGAGVVLPSDCLSVRPPPP